MVLTIKRNDEFFDFFSNYYVYLNNQKYKLAHKQELELELPEDKYEAYSRFYWLRSRKKKITLTKNDAKLEVKLFMDRQQWYKLLAVIGLSILTIIFGNEFFQDLGLFVLKAWLVFYIFMLTIGSDRFMRIIFEED